MALTKVTAGLIAANAVIDSFGTQSLTGDKYGLQSISANAIVNGTITGDKIGVGQITANLFASGAVSTTSISNGNSNVSIASANSNVSIFTAGTKVAEFDSSANFQFNSGYGSLAVAFGCRAWVNFNGTGTPAIREDGNVSSITDNDTGDYTVNFTTAMPDANYSVQSMGQELTGDNKAVLFIHRDAGSLQTSSVRIRALSLIDNVLDTSFVLVAIFR